MRLLTTVAAVSLMASCALAQPRFRVESDSRGVWSLVTPKGDRLFSLGMNNVIPRAWNPRDGTQFYNAAQDQFGGDIGAWAAATRKLLLDNGFNTLGCWSGPQITADDGLYRTPILYVAGFDNDRCLSGLRPGFEEQVRTRTRDAMAAFKDREWVLGVFLDNEMPWWGKSGWDKIPTFTLLEVALGLRADDPARTAALDLLKSRYANPEALGDAWGRKLTDWSAMDAEYARSCLTDSATRDRAAFTSLAADRFFDRATTVVREELPGVLILGTRFAGDSPDPAIAACGRTCDVISLNDYSGDSRANLPLLTRFWLLGKKPLMLTEFSWRAVENTSGNPNTRGAGLVVQTQSERAERYAALLADLMAVPVVVGAHWFEFADQSPQGRFDGEDSNYGIVDTKNRPYEQLLAAMRGVHSRMADLRAGPMKSMPETMPEPRRITYSMGAHPDRPDKLDILDQPARDPETWNAPDASASWLREGKTLVLRYDAGQQWGVGINLFGPKHLSRGSLDRPVFDFEGYSRIVIDIEAPKGLQINVTVYEAASASPGQSRYDVGAGDDGEAFISRPFAWPGGRSTVVLDLHALTRQQFWGNQGGNSNVEMRAIKNLGLQLQGLPQSGTIRVLSFRLER